MPAGRERSPSTAACRSRAGSQLAYDFGAANAPGSPLNDVVNVGGNLTLDGTLNVAVTPGGAFDIGLYRIDQL